VVLKVNVEKIVGHVGFEDAQTPGIFAAAEHADGAADMGL